ncbi:hypothetical protein NP493_48g04060 [Ridgeia piscesae]|uniref:Kinesin-like protein n=1 Tax=Ridgeia piscesae TaxID=27915 RepID=A0AAD9UJI6_RIDPI|nr:hypothetical protein NP493_48g04060 [Ridgeia piscesae]
MHSPDEARHQGSHRPPDGPSQPTDPVETQYQFECVFDDEASQKAVFDRVALPLVEDVLFGKNALLFTYGVTSSGKTHTMTGTPQDQGILPRCFDVIFNSIGDLQAKKYVFKPDKKDGFDVQTVADAMMERQRRDIIPRLTQGGTPRGGALRRKQDAPHERHKRRKVAHTVLNTESSRSHSVFNIRLVQAPLDSMGEEVLQDKEKIVVSQFALVDLAGSERTNRTGNYGERLREAGNINQTLMVLRTCIEALRDNQKNGTNKMVAYRDSRLTHLFKNYFDGEGKVRMVVCINPHANEYDETIQVMRFAEMTQEVQVARPQATVFRGLTPGRRRRNQEYKDAVSQAAVNGVEPPMLPPMIVYTWPPFPPLRSADSFENSGLEKLSELLRERQLRRASLVSDYAQKEERFRHRLLDVDKEQTRLRLRVSELESQLKMSETEALKAQRRLKELDEREWKILLEKTEKDRLRQDYQAKLTLTEQTYNRQIVRDTY